MYRLLKKIQFDSALVLLKKINIVIFPKHFDYKMACLSAIKIKKIDDKGLCTYIIYWRKLLDCGLKFKTTCLYFLIYVYVGGEGSKRKTSDKLKIFFGMESRHSWFENRYYI